METKVVQNHLRLQMSGQRYKLSFEKRANRLFNSETQGFHCDIHAVNFEKMDFTDLPLLQTILKNGSRWPQDRDCDFRKKKVR